MAESACNDDLKFSLLVEGVVRKAQTEITNERSEIIRDVIRFHINTWLDQVEQINPLYKVSELIPVGSYAEGTKIIHADEFDYLAVIEELSKPDVIEIDTSKSDNNKGLVKVVIANEELKLKWGGLCKDGHLTCFQPINFPGIDEKRFGHVVIDTVFKFIRNLKRKFTSAKTPTAIEDCIIVLPAVNGVTLFFTGAVFRAPNVILNFEYENRKVSVDVSPAIRYHKIHDCFKVEDCAGPEFAEVVLRRKSLLLVGTESESDFKVTVTEAEVEYILTVMKPEHKIVYVFLKYIVKLYERVLLDTFTSYMMKTVCIHHDIKCKKDDRSIINCLQTVINDLNVCRQQYFVISIVNKHIHLVSHMDITKDKECLLQGMTAMCQLPAEIETVEEFDTFMKRIVDSERQKRYIVEMEEDKLWREENERFQKEVNESISHIVAMGYDLDEVKKVMGKANVMYDSESALKILKKRAREREEENAKVSDSCSTSSRDGSSHSKGFPLAVYRPQNTTITHEILYQRKKDV